MVHNHNKSHPFIPFFAENMGHLWKVKMNINYAVIIQKDKH